MSRGHGGGIPRPSPELGGKFYVMAGTEMITTKAGAARMSITAQMAKITTFECQLNVVTLFAMTRCISSAADRAIRFNIKNRSRRHRWVCGIVIHWCNKTATVVTETRLCVQCWRDRLEGVR